MFRNLLIGSVSIAVVSSLHAGPLGLQMPPLSSTRIGLTGVNTNSEGVTGYMQNADLGHSVISQGAVQAQRAYMYLAGREHSPGAAGTAAAHGTSTTGMTNMASYMTANGLTIGNLTLSFGQNDGNLTHSWSLKPDTQNLNWSGSAGSNIEERIYAVDAAYRATAEIALAYNGTKIVTFGYTPIYMIITYGGGGGNDSIVSYTDAVSVSKVGALNATLDGFANAIISDITAGGGKAQLYVDTFQTAARTDETPAGLTIGNFSFSGWVQAVPEPATTAGLAGLVALGAAYVARRRRT